MPRGRKKKEEKENINKKSIVKNLLIFSVILISFAFTEYNLLSFIDTYKEDSVKKDIVSIYLEVGKSINLSEYVSDISKVKYASFKNDNIFDLDDSYNILNLQEGEDELYIIFNDHTTQKLKFVSNVEVSSATISFPTTELKKITLNKMNGTGSTAIYNKYSCNKSFCGNFIYYIDSNRTKKMTISSNNVAVPTYSGRVFGGYYTAQNGLGTMVIDANGYIKNNINIKTGTIYAYWISGSFDTKHYGNRCNVANNRIIDVIGCQSSNSGYCKYKYNDNGVNKTGFVLRGNLTSATDNCNNYEYIEKEIIKNEKNITIKSVDIDTNDSCKNSTDFIDGCLVSVNHKKYTNGDSSKVQSIMKHNTVYLQGVLDTISYVAVKKNIQITVKIPSGTFYFTRRDDYKKYNPVNGKFTLIVPKDNIILVGEGQNSTYLKPYGYCKTTNASDEVNCINPEGLTMFSYVPKDSKSEEYLKNVTFKNFTIDAIETEIYNYSTDGKGFHAILCDNCHWDSVTVKNTSGTGFGVDQLINSSITNCTAINCGKSAGILCGKYRKNSAENQQKYGGNQCNYPVVTNKTEIAQLRAEAHGGSGFGIGNGHSNNEGLYISNCKAYNNAKFGFFFEHQSRFQTSKNGNGTTYDATTAKGFVVENSYAEGNLINYGGIRANDVVIKNNISKDPRAYHVYFTEQSRNIFVNNVDVQTNKFKELNDDKYKKYKESVKWATSRGITIGKNEWLIYREEFDNQNYNHNYTAYVGDIEFFSPDEKITRAEAMVMLWRANGSIHIPNDENNKDITAINSAGEKEITMIQNTGFVDVKGTYKYAGAVKWGVKSGIVKGTGNGYYNPNGIITKEHFLIMLYRMAGSPYNGKSSNEWYNITLWLKTNNITSTVADKDNQLSRAEAIDMLYRYYQNYDNIPNKINELLTDNYKDTYSMKNMTY